MSPNPSPPTLVAAEPEPARERADRFLATPPARKVREEIKAKLASYGATPQGRDRLRHLPLLATPQEASKAAQAVMADAALVAGLDRDRVRALLARLAPVPEPVPRQASGRLVACESEDLRESWERRGLHKWVRLSGPDGLRQSDGYDLTVLLYDEGSLAPEAEGVVELSGDSPMAQVAPESVLAWAHAHRAAFEAAAELATRLGRPSKARDALHLAQEAARSRTTPASLRAAVEEVRLVVDRLVRERTAGVVLTGADVLSSLGKRLPEVLQKAVDAALAEGARLLHERTGCSFQPYVAGAPVEVDDDEVEAMERRIEARGHADAFARLGKAAVRLATLRPDLERELDALRAFEVPFALGCFAHENGLAPARFGDRLSFSGSVHLDLAQETAAQRIAYRLGGDEPVALLTGANSGGKTTLLEHVLQLVLLPRLGLPVVGQEVEVPWLEEVHYVTARRSLDAGAFESFLKSFVPVALDGPARLVLADEVEAVTEAEAAARILGVLLDRLHAAGSLAIVVSHMAPQILAMTSAPVRVDGIEATGLDSKNRLVVDRNPRMGQLARSTPELIVQRLAATARGPAREVFEDILGRFREAPVRRPSRRPRAPREGHK